MTFSVVLLRLGVLFSCRFGGWIIDSFPMTRENWIAMTENDLVPDFIIALDDEEAPKDYLLSRFTKVHKLPFPNIDEKDSNMKKEEVSYLAPLIVCPVFSVLTSICSVNAY